MNDLNKIKIKGRLSFGSYFDLALFWCIAFWAGSMIIAYGLNGIVHNNWDFPDFSDFALSFIFSAVTFLGLAAVTYPFYSSWSQRRGRNIELIVPEENEKGGSQPADALDVSASRRRQ